MRSHRIASSVLLAPILFLAIAAPAAAQRDGCFADEPIAGWVAGDLGLDEPGASRPVPPEADGDYELCSDGAGFASESDSYRYLVQRVAGDFAIEAVLLAIDADGVAGLAARWDEATPDAAVLRIAVHATDAGYELRSSMRLDNGGLAWPLGQTLPVTLPISLRIERLGNLIGLSYAQDGETWVGHAGVDASGFDLARRLLVVGMLQASEGTGAQRAIFGEPGAAPPPLPRPDVVSCVDDFAIPARDPYELELQGVNLSSVTGVSVAGVPAAIVSQSDRRLLVQPSAMPASSFVSGDVVVESARGATSAGARVVLAGEPFVRGDVDGDQRVLAGDLIALGLAWLGHGELHCREAADVNADRRIDLADLIHLLRALFFRGPPPAAPYPSPGYAAAGGGVCGLPEGPVIEAVRRARDASERALATLGERPSLREGDVLVIEGSGFGADPARVAVRFGNVRTELLGADSNGLRVRVREVPDAGPKCPLVLLDSAAAVPPPGVAPAPTRFGVAFTVPKTRRDDDALCPDFIASPLAGVNVAQLARDGRSLVLPIDRATWDPTRPLRVSVILPLPVRQGASRGAREISLTFLETDSRVQGDYAEWIARLAARLDRELNGGARAAGCECDATALPGAAGLVITPCDPEITWDDDGTCCDPPYEGPGAQLTAPPPPISTADTFQVTPSSCDGDGSTEPGQRNRVWCEFEKVVRTNPGSGLPYWESYVPLDNMLEGPTGILHVGDPDDRSVSTKSVMFSSNSFYEAIEHGYVNACQAAARAYYCQGGNSDWMPAFTEPQRIVKTFWLRDTKLPPSLDPDELYNYVDPDGVRRNLVGMHLAISTGKIFDYWTWSTFFAPRLVGETEAVDGSPLSWNDACTTGAIADRPAEIEGVWQSYFMCTDGAPGEDGCGNPWGPPNECVVGCNSCHVQVGKVPLPEKPSFPELVTAWLPTLTDHDIADCFDEIKAANEDDGVELFKGLAPDECQ